SGCDCPTAATAGKRQSKNRCCDCRVLQSAWDCFAFCGGEVMAAPKLRFKEFDGDWNKSTIGNFVLNYKGGASLTPADFVEYSDCEVIPKKAISSGGLLQLDKVVPTFCTL